MCTLRGGNMATWQHGVADSGFAAEAARTLVSVLGWAEPAGISSRPCRSMVHAQVLGHLTLRCLAHHVCADMLKSRRISRKIWRNFISDHTSSHQVTSAQYLEAWRSVLLTSPLFYREGFLWAPLQAMERLLANPISVSLSVAKAQILCIGVK